MHGYECMFMISKTAIPNNPFVCYNLHMFSLLFYSGLVAFVAKVRATFGHSNQGLKDGKAVQLKQQQVNININIKLLPQYMA